MDTVLRHARSVHRRPAGPGTPNRQEDPVRRLPGKKTDQHAEALRAVSRDVRRASRIRTGTATTVHISVADLREVLLMADRETFHLLTEVLGRHTVHAVAAERATAELPA